MASNADADVTSTGPFGLRSTFRVLPQVCAHLPTSPPERFGARAFVPRVVDAFQPRSSDIDVPAYAVGATLHRKTGNRTPTTLALVDPQVHTSILRLTWKCVGDTGSGECHTGKKTQEKSRADKRFHENPPVD